MKNTNSGDRNSGYFNSGHLNSGNRNSGNRNSGNRNSGDRNSGDRNSGNQNSGHFNSGDRNSGDRNSGHVNTGNFNSGNRNSGNFNSGNFNSGDFNSGAFCTDEPYARLFNKTTNKKIGEIEFPDFLYFKLTEWVEEGYMSDQEKINHPACKTTGGYLKTYDYKEAFRKSWDAAPDEDRKKLFALPNFDAEIFKEVSGIDVNEKATVTVSVDGKETVISRESAVALNLV